MWAALMFCPAGLRSQKVSSLDNVGQGGSGGLGSLVTVAPLKVDPVLRVQPLVRILSLALYLQRMWRYYSPNESLSQHPRKHHRLLFLISGLFLTR